MARDISRLVSHVCFYVLLLHIASAEVVNDNPEFHSVKFLNTYNFTQDENYRKIEFEVRGYNIKPGMYIKATKTSSAKNTKCKEDLTFFYNVSEVWTSDSASAKYVLLLPKNISGDLYLCLPHELKDASGSSNLLLSGIKHTYEWYHQGPNVRIYVPYLNYTSPKHRNVRDEAEAADEEGELPDLGFRVMGLRVEAAYKDPSFDENGIPELLSERKHTIRIFGYGLKENMLVTFAKRGGRYGHNCLMEVSEGFVVKNIAPHNETALVDINLSASSESKPYFICVKDVSSNSFVFQGTETWLQVQIHDRTVPVWVAIVIICLCLCFSALFSGLNLGLMALDRTELKILCNTGTAKERKCAAVIQPVRDHGNYLLCSILLGNVFVNSIFTILLDDLTSGLIAVVFSTLCIVIIGEITPQAICSRHGLTIGAKTIYITKFIMVLTFPLSYPISKFLDCVLGEEIGNVYNRERLKELVKVTTGENDLDKDEVNIISGALELRKKTVAEVMTKIEDVYMLDYDAVLDFETVSEIMKTGFSRVPVYEGTRQNIVTMLYIKDLAFVDPDDNTPLKTLCQFYQNPINFVFEDCTLDVMFKIFKEGNKGHMAFVQRVNNEGEGDPFYETIGLITLEDVIEELIQAEIMDETDVFTDNRSKRKRVKESTRQDFSVFAERRGESNIQISPQLTLAAFQYLNTTVELFHPHVISETILRRLLKQDIYFVIKKHREWRSDPTTVIYQQGKAADYFVMILEGRVEVQVGRECLNFTGGPFTYFGTQALVQTIGVAESPSVPSHTLGSLESLNIDSMLKFTFLPDYTVRASTEVLYMKIKRSLYFAAKRATLMERSQKDNMPTSDQFDAEVDKHMPKLVSSDIEYSSSTEESTPRYSFKLLHSLGDDEFGIGGATPRKRSSRNLQNSQDLKAIANYPGSPKASVTWNVNPKDINGSVKGLSEETTAAEVSHEEDTALLSTRKS